MFRRALAAPDLPSVAHEDGGLAPRRRREHGMEQDVEQGREARIARCDAEARS
jgi:hypothetical protein